VRDGGYAVIVELEADRGSDAEVARRPRRRGDRRPHRSALADGAVETAAARWRRRARELRGSAADGPRDSFDPDLWARQFAVNVSGPFQLIGRVIRQMAERRRRDRERGARLPASSGARDLRLFGVEGRDREP
jgi:NAD(P)-dependent dehydrogenase (short-subunit alcohol dehydrogenase family)